MSEENDTKGKETKKEEQERRFNWFMNDADGLSILDFLATSTFIFYIITKIVHMYLSIRYIENANLINQLNFIMDDINVNMNVIIGAYFVKKAVDTTVTKVGLFSSGQYTQILDPTLSNNIIKDNQKDDLCDADPTVLHEEFENQDNNQPSI